MLTLNKASNKFSIILKGFSLGLLLLMGSCSSPRDASKDNFKRIIGQSIKNDKVCTVGYYKFPQIVPDSSKDEYKNKVENDLALFVKQGWVKIEKSMVNTFPSVVSEMSTVYDLTPEGSKNSRIDSISRNMGTRNTTYYKFCYAQGKEIIEINAFGDPVEEGGRKIVKVPFTYKVTGKKDDWINQYPDKSQFTEVNFDEFTLTLTNEGWQVLGRTRERQMFSDLSK